MCGGKESLFGTALITNVTNADNGAPPTCVGRDSVWWKGVLVWHGVGN